MNKTKSLAWLSLVLVLVLAACGGQETTEPVEQQTPTTAPVPTEAPPTEMPPTVEPEESGSYLDSVEHIPDAALIDVTWEWLQRAQPDGEVTIEVTDPALYTLLFNADGTFNTQLDCNVAAGGYATLAGGSIFMELGPMTMAACGPESLADQMMQMFGPAQDYRFEDEGQTLIFSWAAGGPVDTFRRSAPEGAADVSAAHVADPALVDKTWQWEQRVDPSAADNITVTDPAQYLLAFAADGTFISQIDCNVGQGEYSTGADGSLSMLLGPMTMVACEPDSLAPQMSQMFGAADSYRIEEDGQVLVIGMADGGPEDIYRVAPQPGAEALEAIPEDALTIDLQGLADSYVWEVRPAIPLSPGPGAVGYPAHILVTFDGETPDDVLANNGRRMFIFPTQAYLDLYAAQGSTAVESQVARLQTLISEAETREAMPESPMPLLPPPSSFMDRWAQFADLNFAVGEGVRYVSEAPNRQAIGAWTNLGTAYYYQGLTSDDGLFYVSLIWPVATDSLPNTPDDVPEDVAAQASDPETNAAYLQTTKDTLNALPSSAWTPDLASLDALAQSVSFPLPAGTDLVGATWQWLGTTTPVEQIDIAEPTRYTITFNADGTAAIKADCNNVLANYTFDGSAISITPGPSTLAACPPDSQDQLFISQLSSAAIAFFQEGDLYIDLFADGGTMRFAAQETVDLPEPAQGDPTATVNAPDGVFLRSGPGTEYPEVGTAVFGDTGTIVGQSEDGQWWVIDAPELPGGQVWVSAQFVDVQNAGSVPVVAAPDSLGLVGVNWQWASLTTPVAQTDIADPTRYTILFNADGTANITADCNVVGASYSATPEGALTIALGPSTLAACPPDSQDQLFLQSLSNAAIYFTEAGQLYIDQMADGGTMRFLPGTAAAPGAGAGDSPTASAQNIEFSVTSFGPVGAEAPLLPGTQITALFTSTDASGSAGCNTYTGAVTPVENFFTVGPIATTLMACSEPAGIMEQESSYLAALGALSGFQWVQEPVGGQSLVTAGQLFYTTPDGAAGVINLISTQ